MNLLIRNSQSSSLLVFSFVVFTLIINGLHTYAQSDIRLLLSENNQRLAELKEIVRENNNKFDILQKSITDNKQELVDLQKRISLFEESISFLETKLRDLDSKQEAFDSKDENLNVSATDSTSNSIGDDLSVLDSTSDIDKTAVIIDKEYVIDAEQKFLTVIEENTATNPIELLQLAQDLRYLGRYSEARGYLEQYRIKYPQDDSYQQTIYISALAANDSGDYQGCVNLLQYYFEHYPIVENFEARWQLASCYKENQASAKYLEILKKIAEDEDDPNSEKAKAELILN